MRKSLFLPGPLFPAGSSSRSPIFSISSSLRSARSPTSSISVAIQSLLESGYGFLIARAMPLQFACFAGDSGSLRGAGVKDLTAGSSSLDAYAIINAEACEVLSANQNEASRPVSSAACTTGTFFNVFLIAPGFDYLPDFPSLINRTVICMFRTAIQPAGHKHHPSPVIRRACPCR